MSQRYAKTNDIWRHLYKRNDFPIKSIEFKYKNIEKLGTGLILFESPISILCGENGVGKSTLLKLLKSSLQGNIENKEESSTEFNLITHIDGVYSSITSPQQLIEHFEQNDNADVRLFDPSIDIPVFLAAISKDANHEDLLNGVDPIIVPEETLSTIKQIVGKAYDKIEIYELDEVYGFKQFPYFKVFLGPCQYSPINMGLGEFSLLYLFWLINQSPKSSILLIEEPESFIPPRSQRHLLDWLAEKCIERKYFVLLSTHSPQIASRIPKNHLHFCSRDHSGVSILTDPASHILAERLAIISHRRCLIFVEDEAALYLAKCLIRLYDDRLSNECVFAIANSNGEISAALKSIPSFSSKTLKIIGLYDGDQNKIIKQENFRWPVHFLPTDDSPEELLQKIILSTAVEKLSETLGHDISLIRVAFSETGARNSHDWLTDVICSLDMSMESFMSAIIPIVAQAKNDDCKKFISKLNELSIL